jgi:putative PIN family toxin of toxin-antitoxin system
LRRPATSSTTAAVNLMPARGVIDTNVLVSGLISGQGPPRRIVDAWLDGRFLLITSLYQVEELHHVLTYPRIASRIRLEEAELELLLVAFLSQAELVPGHYQLPGITRDPKDDAVVSCAVEGEADFIVSGDQDLLVLGEYEGIRFVTPRDFVELLAL